MIFEQETVRYQCLYQLNHIFHADDYRDGPAWSSPVFSQTGC